MKSCTLLENKTLTLLPYHTGSAPSSISQQTTKTLNPNQIKYPKFSSIQFGIEMNALKFKPFSSIISPSHLRRPPFTLLLRLFSSPSSSSLLAGTAEDPNFNLTLFSYLINTFKFSETQAHTLSTRFSYVKSLEKPQSVCDYFRNLGFSNTQVIESVRVVPQILFLDVDKTLKPKIQYFQDLGLVGPDLGKFICKNSSLLTVSLEKKLVPGVENLKRVLLNDKNNKNLFKALRGCDRIVRVPPDRFLSRIAFFESCGIVGSQLSMLLTRQPRLFAMSESVLRDVVSRTLKMGISVDSRMFVYGLYTVSCISVETFEKKCGIFESFGFSRDETIEMFRKAPSVFRCSEEKLKLGLEFFLNTVKIDKEQLVQTPTVLMCNVSDRAIARYRVLEVMKSKRLLKKEPSFISVMLLGEEKFLERYILSYTDYAQELSVAYKSRLSDSPSDD